MLYLLQVSVYTAAMLLVYVLFLRNKSLFSVSRAYLVASAVLPLIVPFVQVPVALQQKLQTATGFRIDLPALTVSAGNTTVLSENTTPVLWLLYIAIACFIMLKQLWGGAALWRLIKNSRKERYAEYTLITNSRYGPGSFGRYIFFPGDEINETILAHELAHTRLHHTLDLIFLNLLQAAAWPNICLVFLKNELRQVHEFQADSYINTDAEDYALLLLSSLFNTCSIPVMHLFIIHPIKRRIMMLQKRDTAAPAKAVLQVSASLCLLLVVVFGVQSCSKKVPAAANQNNTAAIVPGNKIEVQGAVIKGGDLKNLQSMPRLEGYADFLAKELKYPEYARKNKIAGKVMIRFTVAKDGSVLNPEVLRSPDTSLSTEALRVMNKMPKWEPGVLNGEKVNVEFQLPVLFKLE